MSGDPLSSNSIIQRLQERAAWLRREYQNGGDFEHLSAREQECTYIAHDVVQPVVQELQAEIERLKSLINTPHTAEFLTAVQLEAVHQRERWGSEHDSGKTDADWFWLIGYLAGKALSKPEKQLHHIITTAAACLNWHAARTGWHTNMRPGIEPPAGEPV